MLEVKERWENHLLGKENVVSVGLGKKEVGGVPTDIDCITVGVTEKKTPANSNDMIPETIEGYPTDVIEVGEITAPPNADFETMDKKSRKDRWRPVPQGVSCGHVQISAGTESFLLKDKDGNIYSASNNHVKADVNKGEKGDSIIQPGSADGGSPPQDTTGTLAGYVKVEDGVTVDLAWEKPTKAEFENKLLGIGQPKGDVYDPQVGDKIVKSGRTSGVTHGKVKKTHATVKVRYGKNKVVKLKRQVISTKMLSPGDSGSACLEENSHRPALLGFAGSNKVSVFNYASNVEKESGMKIVTAEGEGGGGGKERPTARIAVLMEPKTQKGDVEFVVADKEDKSPVQGAKVEMNGRTAETDSKGIARIPKVPIKTYHYTVTHPDYKKAEGKVEESDFKEGKARVDLK